MDSVTSHKNSVKFYLGLAGFFILFFSIGFFLIITGSKQYNLIPKPPKTDLMIVFGSISVLFSFYFIYSYIKNTPKIVIDRKAIRFNKQYYEVNTIQEIIFSTKHSFMLSKVEGIKIHFKNGETRFIFDLMYTNYYLLKQYLEHVTTSEGLFKPYIVKSTKEINPGHVYNYKGIFLFSFRGILYIILCIPILIVASTKEDITGMLFGTLFTIVFYFVFGTHVYYVQSNDDFLVIKNHLFFWTHHIYYLSDIVEVVYETQSKQPNNIRIVTKDYRTKLYGAGTLSNAALRSLKTHLEAKGIRVRNEIGI